MKKTVHFPLFLLLLLFSTISFAQVALEDFSTIPDSLKTKSNDELISYLRANLYSHASQDEFIMYANTLLERAVRENNVENRMRANYYYCHTKEAQGDYKGALDYMQKALDIVIENNLGEKKLVYLYRKIALINFRLGNFEAALKNYVAELKIAKKIKDYHREIEILRNIALLKLDVGDKKDAYRVLKINLKILDSIDKTDTDYPRALQERIGSMMALGKNYTLFGQLDKALQTYKDAYELSKEKFPIESIYLKAGFGNVYTLKKEYNKALSHLYDAEKFADSLNIKDLKPFIYLHKGNAFFGLKKYKQAIQELTELDSFLKIEQFNYIELQSRYPVLAKSYDALGDYKKSKENYEKFVALDAKNDDLKLDIVSTIYELYDIDLLEAQIKDLSEEAENKEKSLSTTKLIIIVLIILIIVLFAYFQYKAHQNQKRFEALLNKPTTVKKLTPVKKPQKVDRKKLIPEEKAQELLAKLEKLEKQQVFLDQNCTISWLAKKMGTNASYASIIINDFRQKKFPEYLSELRIDYATERLKEDPKFRSYTIKSIASDVGYKSPEAFSKSFKKINGIYPSYFIKKLNEKAQNAA